MSLFVGNIPLSVSSAELQQLFGKLGSCRVDLQTGKKPVQFAVVTYPSEKEAIAAVEALNETTLQGNVIRVKFSGGRQAPQQGERSRSPDRAGKTIVQLAPTHVVAAKVVNLQAGKQTIPTVVQLSAPKLPAEGKPVGVVSLAKPLTAVLANPVLPAQTAAPESAKPVPAPRQEPAKPAEVAKPSEKPQEPAPPRLASVPSSAAGPQPQAKPQSIPPPPKPVSQPTVSQSTPSPQSTAQSSVPAQSSSTVPLPKPPAKPEEAKAEEEPDPDGFVAVPDKPEDVKCLPCGKVLKRAARKAHAVSKAHIKNKEGAKA